MAILVICVLAILWAAVLVPPILRSRAESGAAGGISDFFGRLRDGLGSRGHGDGSLPPLQPIVGPVHPMGGPIGPTASHHAPVGPVQVPGGMSPAQRRRRDVLVILLAAVAITLVMALFSSGVAFWVVHFLTDGLLGGYVFLLLQMKSRNGATERRPVAEPVRPGPVVPSLPNVHDLTARRFPPATAPSRMEAPREATVLALRRSASW